MKEIKLHHAYAVVCGNNFRKCELILIDNSKYYFKFQECSFAEHWAHCVNVAASLLSKLPFLSHQPNITRVIINYQHWSSEITKLDFDHQKIKIKEFKKQFELDFEHLNNLKTRRKSDKESLKSSEKNLNRFRLYHRTLKTLSDGMYQSLLKNGSKNILSPQNGPFDNTEPSTSSNINSNLFSSFRQHPADISNIIPNTDVTEDI